MTERPGFSQLIREGHQYLLPLPLPPAPGIKFKADNCPRCQSIHLSQLERVRCQILNSEQR